MIDCETKKQQTTKKKMGGPKRRHSISISSTTSIVDEWVASVNECECVASVQKYLEVLGSSTYGTGDDQSSTPSRKQ